jgi:predicted transcriptional regulator
MEEIKILLDVSPMAILPQIKRLTDSDLVAQKDGSYELTDLGFQVFKKVQSLVNVLILLEKDNYWLEHDLSGIPQYLIDRIGDMKDFSPVKPDPIQIFEPNTELLNFFSSSRYLMLFSSFYRPEFLSLYSKLGSMRSEVTLIFTESVLEKILYNHESSMRKFVSLQNTELFVCNDGAKLVELIISDRGMMASLFDSNGRFYHDYIYCSGSQAINWATELFEFYKSRAWQVESETAFKNFVRIPGNEALSKPILLTLQ